MTNPVLVSFIRVTDIVVSYMLQVLVFTDTPSVLAMFGSSLIIISVTMLSCEQFLTNMAPTKIKHFL